MGKKVLIAIATIIVAISVFYLGYSAGKKDVIDNQVIYDEHGDKGFYYSEYNGNLYKYWSEK